MHHLGGASYAERLLVLISKSRSWLSVFWRVNSGALPSQRQLYIMVVRCFFVRVVLIQGLAQGTLATF